MKTFALILSLTGVIYIITGYLLKWFPPKKKNMLYGYRIGKAIQSQRAWELSQPFAAKQMIRQGFIFLALGLLALPIPSSQEKLMVILGIILPIGIILFGVGYLIYKTEKYVEKELSSFPPATTK